MSLSFFKTPSRLSGERTTWHLETRGMWCDVSFGWCPWHGRLGRTVRHVALLNSLESCLLLADSSWHTRGEVSPCCLEAEVELWWCPAKFVMGSWNHVLRLLTICSKMLDKASRVVYHQLSKGCVVSRLTMYHVGCAELSFLTMYHLGLSLIWLIHLPDL
jgi:hypothetical protein